MSHPARSRTLAVAMVSFAAFDGLPLAEGVGVAALACWSDLLYVGTSDGRLLLLSLHTHVVEGGAAGRERRIMGVDEEAAVSLGVGSAAVEEVVVVAAAGHVVVRCAGRVFVRDLASLAPCPDAARYPRGTMQLLLHFALTCARRDLYAHASVQGTGICIASLRAGVAATDACLCRALTSLRGVTALALQQGRSGGGLCVVTGGAGSWPYRHAATSVEALFFRLDEEYVLERSYPLARAGVGGVKSVVWWGDVVYVQFGQGSGGGSGGGACLAMHVPSGREHALDTEWSMPPCVPPVGRR